MCWWVISPFCNFCSYRCVIRRQLVSKPWFFTFIHVTTLNTRITFCEQLLFDKQSRTVCLAMHCNLVYLFTAITSHLVYLFTALTSHLVYLFTAITSHLVYLFTALISHLVYLFTAITSHLVYLFTALISHCSLQSPLI